MAELILVTDTIKKKHSNLRDSLKHFLSEDLVPSDELLNMKINSNSNMNFKNIIN